MKAQKSTFSTAADLKLAVGAVEFLVPPWLASGFVTLLISTPGLGKTYLALDMTRRLLKPEQGWFDGEPLSVPPGKRVLWCDTESAQAILVERIQLLGIPGERLVLPFEDPLREVRLDDAHDQNQLELVVDLVKPILIVVDSLRGSHGREENDSGQMQKVLHWLSKMAQKYEVTVLVLHHTNKPAPGLSDVINSVNRIRGSSTIGALCRIVLALDKPNPESDNVRLQMIKNNMAPLAACRTFEVTPNRHH